MFKRQIELSEFKKSLKEILSETEFEKIADYGDSMYYKRKDNVTLYDYDDKPIKCAIVVSVEDLEDSGIEDYRYMGTVSIINLTGKSDDIIDLPDAIRDGEGVATAESKIMKSANVNSCLDKYLLYQANIVSSMPGFVMDRPANRIGNSGWDFLLGDLSLEKAKKNRKELYGMEV